ncbi:MAG: tetratricopeptide repeat protein [Bacteroidetes bacterium]|nr:tetratricopeptide repeat protein [Bacteroidota bacterium]
MKKAVLFTLLIIEGSTLLNAQDTLQLRDAQEIQLLAQRKVEKGLADLLNTIIFEDLGEFERKSIMADSYGESPNKLFYNASVIVEDDINPEHTGTGRPQDLPIDKYLSNLELFYKKSIDRTIVFSEFRVSNVKKSDYFYVKVYFKSHFQGTHNQVASPYQPVSRVAEVRAERRGKKWAATIAGLAFVAPDDSAHATRNDVYIVQNEPLLLASGNENQVLREAELAREKEREEERKAQEEYNRYLDTGDKALAEKDYEKALEAFTEAEKRNVYDDLLPRRKIYQVKRAFEQMKQTNADLLREYLTKATVARNKRQYTEAIGYFRKAAELKPDSTALGETIQLLNSKSRIKTELDEKYNAGNYTEVIKDYSGYIRKDKGNSDYYLGRGLAYYKTNKLKSALEDFDKAIELDYSNLAAFEARARLYEYQKELPKAIADLTSYLNIDPANTDVLAYRANLRILTRNTKGAFEDYDRAIELAPGVAEYHYLRGLLQAQSAALPEAIRDFSEAIVRNGKYGDALFQRGLAYVKTQKIMEAGADFGRLREVGETPEQSQQIGAIASELFQKGINAYGQQAFRGAIAHFDESIKIHPGLPDTWYYRGLCLGQLSDRNNALASFSTALKLKPDYSEAFFERGKIHFKNAEFSLADVDFKSSRTLAPTFYLAYLGEADALFYQKLFPKAIQAYETIKTLDKKIGNAFSDSIYSEAYNRLGICYFETGAFEKAIEEFSRSLSNRNTFSDAYLNRGMSYQATKNLKRAVADYQRAVALDVNNPGKCFILANGLLASDDVDEALRMYTRVIELDAKNACCQAKAYYGKGESFYLNSQFERAAESYLMAFGLDSTLLSEQSAYNAGVGLLFQRKPEEARGLLAKAATKLALSAEAYYGLGCANLLLKNKQEALQWFEKAFQTGGKVTRTYVRKDKLIEFCDKSFANDEDFKNLVSRLLKR